ncbi:MAG: hypothetical protein QY302_00665 [Anaerolineales bacterium]|nr:MAG: hypothetical protein QY302_00665 [Anaerolineales bacterium]
MRTISLSVDQFTAWLAQKGTKVKEPFWQILVANCASQSSFEHEFLVESNNIHGTVHISALFVSLEKLISAGWQVSKHEGSQQKIFVTTIVIRLSLHRLPSKHKSLYLTSYLSVPEYTMKVDSPNIVDLDSAWKSIERIAPKINSLAISVSKSLEFELVR